jgi:hypothetical protein
MNRPKMVFIAHPISGDVENNCRKVLEICRQIHTKDVIPVFPRFTWCQYLTDSPEDKELALAVAEAYFRSGAVDELWVYGDVLSEGMKKEIWLAQKLGIKVVPMSEITAEDIEALNTPCDCNTPGFIGGPMMIH